MRILIVTQKMDRSDSVLGFMHGWVTEFSRHAKVSVICLERGTVALPEGIRVLSLGKERGRSRMKYLYNFYRYIFSLRKEYDSVFVHMNYEYVILGGLLWRLWGKRIGLWYAHGHVPRGLHLAVRLAHDIFTSTPSGFRISSPKVHVVGQGIDTRLFSPNDEYTHSGTFRIVSVGRLSPIKDYDTLITATRLLKERGVLCAVTIAGTYVGEAERAYYERLLARIEQEGLTGVFVFAGAIANYMLPGFLRTADVFVNMSHTGSLDKAGLEAMAMAIPVLSCNEAFGEVLSGLHKRLLYTKGDARTLADLLQWLAGNTQESHRIGALLRTRIVESHSLPKLITKILSFY